MSRILHGILCVLISATAYAEPFSIRMVGRESATITTARLTIGDIAEVTPATAQDDDAAIALRKIALKDGITPGMSLTVSADEVLRSLQRAGVDTKRVGYSLPRVITARRVGRAPEVREVMAALQSMLIAQGRSAEVRDIRIEDSALIDIEPADLTAIPLVTTNPGHVSAQIVAKDADGVAQRFQVQARVEEWREVPVAARTLSRGTVVAEDDLQMARMNVANLPSDAMPKIQAIVGLQASKDIPFGDVIRKSRVVIPPVVTTGSRVTMIYRSGALELTASGTALENAAPGSEVKVRNELSKKIISGVAQEDGMVLVSR